MKLKLTDSGIIVVKGVSTIKASAGEEEGVVDFIASSNSVDRDGDIVRQDGLILDFYKQNPVFLWAHNSWEPPIGRAIDQKMNDEGNFQIKVQFDLDDQFAHKIYRKYAKGFMKMVSIGFLPHELEERDTGYGFVFTKTEIMEVSAVPVGSNRKALALERGQDARTTKSMDFDQWLKENGHVIIKSHPVNTQIKSPDAPADEEPTKAPEGSEADDKSPEAPTDEPQETAEEPKEAPEQDEKAPEEPQGADEPEAPEADPEKGAEADEQPEKGAEGDDGDTPTVINNSVTLDVDELAQAVAAKLSEGEFNKSSSVVLNIDGRAFVGKSTEEVAKAIQDLIGSTTHGVEEPSEVDSPSPVKVPDASGPKPATLKVVSGNRD